MDLPDLRNYVHTCPTAKKSNVIGKPFSDEVELAGRQMHHSAQLTHVGYDCNCKVSEGETTILSNIVESHRLYAQLGSAKEWVRKSDCGSELDSYSVSKKNQVGVDGSLSVSSQASEVSMASNKNESLIIPCIAVYMSNYNFSVLAIAMYIMTQDLNYKSVTMNVLGDASIKMLSYAGAVVGQFTMGYLGDFLGRKKAMIVTLLFTLIGTIGCAFCTSCVYPGNESTSAYPQMTTLLLILISLFRFLLGVGSGGVYPLSAVSAAEGTASSKAEDRSPRVSWAYFCNVPGIISPYVLAAITWSITKNVETNFRILVGFGALPTIIIVYCALHSSESVEFRLSRARRAPCCYFILQKQHARNLFATGFSWFLYDVAAYGILLAQPDISGQIWGTSSSVNDIINQGIILNCMAIPGALMGILVVKQMGLRMLQFWGFIALAGSSTAMALVVGGGPTVQTVMLATVNFCINWGAAVTTFILPSTVFPPECRSTYNGIAAAMGKVGAIVGIYSLRYLLFLYGLSSMMIATALVSVTGAIITWLYVGQRPKTFESTCIQTFGSLLACIPFIDLRKSSWR